VCQGGPAQKSGEGRDVDGPVLGATTVALERWLGSFPGAQTRYSFLGDKHMFFWLLTNLMSPPAVFLLPFFQLYSSIGLFDTPLAVALALLELLTQLSAAEIAAFDNLFEDLRASAETQDMANAAVLIEHGFLGDDSFDDFRAGLVALGRTVFEGAVANPDSLANHQLVREIAASNDPRWLGREDMLFVASHAYAVVTGEDEVTFYDFAEGQRADPERKPEEDDEDEEFWTVEDEAETRRRLPRLAELFYERSTRNRTRAMEKLGLQD
jgi:hypothetical protein